jgi:predicted RNA-binding protein associated with RNAse of E/G family
LDSVWIETGENPKTIIQYKDLNGDGDLIKRTSHTSYRPLENKSKDSIIKNLYTWTDLNYEGRFWRALMSVSKRNTFVYNYLDIANSGGPVQPELLIDEMLGSNPNYSDYFIKRIIVTSLSY